LSDKFFVKSRFDDYEVSFTDTLVADLEAFLRDGDALVVDEAVLEAHRGRLQVLVDRWPTLPIHASERAKSFEEIGGTLDRLVSMGFRKNGRLVVLGGGVVQDVAAFISTVLYRGVEWIFIPTTLLAQGDSCIGGKSSINFRGYKNLLGSFLPPSRILIDLEFLRTLPRDQVTSGLGEILHFLLYAGETEFAFLESNIDRIRADSQDMKTLLRLSLSIKKAVIEVDELDRGVRQLFNYGHSFGHAIEAVTEYAIPHGIAVSFGMDIANYVSVGIGLAEEGFRDRVRRLASTLWEGFTIRDLDVDALFGALRKDKKNVGSDVYVILASGFGGTVKRKIDLEGPEGALIKQYFTSEAY
jgi:3-dehydroquinate synthase